MQPFRALTSSKKTKPQNRTPQRPTFEELENRELLAADVGIPCEANLVASNFGQTSTVPSSTLPGDANGDGTVDGTDLNRVGLHWQSSSANGPSQGDFNNDRKVDATDLNLLALNWRKSIVSTLPGDADGDGKVDATDLNVVGQNWQTATDNGSSDGDFDGDRKVDAKDLNILALNWQKGISDSAATSVETEDLRPPSTLSGDANGDGRVDATDLNVVGQHWQTATDNGSADGDFDGDGVVTAKDLNILALNWQNNASTTQYTSSDYASRGLIPASLLRQGDTFMETDGTIHRYVGGSITNSLDQWADITDPSQYTTSDYASRGLVPASLLRQGDTFVEADGTIHRYVGGGITNSLDQWEDISEPSVSQPGDANGDGRVDAADLNTVALNWQTSTDNGSADGDFNVDLKVDVKDLNILALHWRQGTGPA